MVLSSIRHLLQQASYLVRIWLKCRRSWFSWDGVVSEMSEATGVVHWLWRGLRGGHVQKVVERRADGEPLGDISEEVEGGGEDTSHSDDHRWSQSLKSGRTKGIQNRHTEAIVAKRVEGLQDILRTWRGWRSRAKRLGSILEVRDDPNNLIAHFFLIFWNLKMLD